ncbi:hypothetical protein CLU79DRAFT_733628 [Phycomyces nitens]|nr:hypothetical protein CLU79DRAFT_733628 [Phycomyces nitens]
MERVFARIPVVHIVAACLSLYVIAHAYLLAGILIFFLSYIILRAWLYVNYPIQTWTSLLVDRPLSLLFLVVNIISIYFLIIIN